MKVGENTANINPNHGNHGSSPFISSRIDIIRQLNPRTLNAHQMPPRNRNRRRTGRRPNVFVQTEQPTGRRETPDQTEAESASPPAAQQSQAATPAPVAQQSTRAPRRTQRTRSEVYARTFPIEIRKIGILAAGIVVALTVFTIVL